MSSTDNVRALIPKDTRAALAAGAVAIGAKISDEIDALPALGQVIEGFNADLSAADFNTCQAWLVASIDALPSAKA